MTCGDEAPAMRVIWLDEVRGLALCEDGPGRRRWVEIELVAPVGREDWLLVHAGTALAKVERSG